MSQVSCPTRRVPVAHKPRELCYTTRMKKSAIALVGGLLAWTCAARPVCIGETCYMSEEAARAAGVSAEQIAAALAAGAHDDAQGSDSASKKPVVTRMNAQREDNSPKEVIQNIMRNMVAIPGKNFKMGKYEVTQAQWAAVMGENPSRFKGANNPVEKVSWNDCKAFLEKLNARPEVKKSGLTFRLPTEEEWEYACRAGSTGDYCKLADGTEITGNTLGEVAWYEDNSGDKTHPVGQKKPNAFGLYDMHGNVWEWCEDLYRAGGSRRVYRGGGWRDSSRGCTAGYRVSNPPDTRDYRLGFRLAASQDVNR